MNNKPLLEKAKKYYHEVTGELLRETLDVDEVEEAFEKVLEYFKSIDNVWYPYWKVEEVLKKYIGEKPSQNTKLFEGGKDETKARLQI